MDRGTDGARGVGDSLSGEHQVADLDARLRGCTDVLSQRQHELFRKSGVPDCRGVGQMLFFRRVDTSAKGPELARCSTHAMAAGFVCRSLAISCGAGIDQLQSPIPF